MLRDVFYYGDKPNAHPREKFAKSLDDARQQATTEHFWIINEFCDYKDFDWDFDFELLHDSDVWAIDHNNVWPSLYQKDSGTWLCPQVESSIVVYRADVEPLKRKNILSSNWKIESEVDITKFDFGWHPDPADPPYIYRWGCKYFPVEIQSFLEYHTPGATSVKYLTDTVELLPQYERWVEYDKVDTTKFDFSWRPDPREPPFIYVWGNKFVDGRIQSTIEYHVPNATQKKYMDEPVEVLPLHENWVEKDKVDPLKFDFSWRPNPTEPPYIYIWGNKFIPGELQPTLEYHVPGATEKKYMAEPVEILPLLDCWTEYQPVDKDNFDMSWRPDPREPPFIYVWGNKYIPGELMPTLEFTVPGATLKKYIPDPVPVLPHVDRINIMQKLHEKHLDTESECFNISWRPDPRDPPFIYVWGNKYIPGEIKPTLEYRVPGATKRKYMKELLEVEPEWHCWVVKIPIDKEKNIKNGFDFSWRPDPREPPYIYTWGNKYINAEDRPTLEYHVEGATDRKYMGNTIETLPDWDRWRILKNVDKSSFDFSWMPDPKEPPFIYRFGNQHYDARTMPTIEYHTPGSHLGEYKYIDDVRAELLPNPDRFEHHDYVSGLDYSWVPNPNDPPYIYVWGNQWNKPEDKASVKYIVPGATEFKYMEERVTRKPVMDNWIIPNNLDVTDFDFSWEPNPNDPPYIYQFGTQWQRSGGPRYVIPGATEIKYVDILKAKALPNKNKFEAVDRFKIKDFDYSWHPDSADLPYIYVFGNKYYNAEKMPTVKYVVPGATEIKYINDVTATLEHDKTNFKINIPIDESKFDFAWLPDPNDPPYIYVFGNQWNEGTVESTVEYHAEGATEKKYINFIKATILPNMSDNWDIPDYIDKDSFDFSWRPNPKDPALIYDFGTQWHNLGGPRYVCEGATEVKCIEGMSAKALPRPNDPNWHTVKGVEIEDFDYTWYPNPNDPPYIYVFGNQFYPAEIMPSMEYRVPGAKEYKYINIISATLKADKSKFTLLRPIVESKFDFSWKPNPKDPPYIYVFGNQWHDAVTMPTVLYEVKGATEHKYVNDIKATLAHNKENWHVDSNIDDSNFDYSWVPNPNDPGYIYEFGTQWQKTGGPRYIVPNATEVKYVDAFRAKRLPNLSNWEIPPGIDVSTFDFSWHPDSTEPERIYQFGTLENDNDGPRYIFTTDKTKELETVRLLRVNKEEHTTEIKISKYVIQTTLDDLVKDHPNEIFWALNKNIDYTNFDFSWRPDIEQARYVHVFGSPDYPITHTYFVSATMYLQGNKDFNYVEKDKKLDSGYLAKLFKHHDMFYIDRGNIESGSRFDQLQKLYPNIQKTRFTNSFVDTINRCVKKSTTPLCWILNSELDYTDFNFEYYPTQWQMKMIHIFGTQWSHWGTTVLVNCETFPEYTKYVKILEHLQNINFVKDRKAKATNNLYDIYLVDHGNPDIDDIKLLLERKSNGKPVTVIKLEDTYFNTIKSLLHSLPDRKEHYIWLCNSVCDYTDFDFSYICDPFARDNLHVFPTENQKYGDTFFIDVNSTKALLDHMTDIEDYTKLNFNYHQRAKRLVPPKFVTTDDSHANHIKYDFEFPYAIYCTEDIEVKDEEPIALWNKETKNILVTTTGATRIIVPREAKSYIKNELYDYPYIKTVSKVTKSKPLDIVYLSNGEKEAEINYEHLLRCTKNAKNRIVRVDGINGRVQAYHAALEASETSWAFTVFAKLKVNESFDWNWQPDRLQNPKHYIFNAINPLNGLIYGHQAMIAYNKKLVLANKGSGLDFTLDDPHESVDMISGTANFNTDEYSTWRTAFREVIKLQSAYDDTSKLRLKTWLLDAKGKYSKQCLLGSFDAVEYYKSVNGDIDKLKLSYEWDWLTEYYNRKYN